MLEIWYELTLETRFGTKRTQSYGYYQRWALVAAEWLDNRNNPLPDLYDRAGLHCIQMPADEERVPDGEDIKFWGAVCRDVVEPLSKNCS